MSRRVVITGLGMITPLGLDTASTWEAIVAGRGGVGPITKFDAAGYPCTIAAEVRGFDPEKYLKRKDVRKMDIFSHYAIGATREALDDARITVDVQEFAGLPEVPGERRGEGPQVIDEDLHRRPLCTDRSRRRSPS